MNAIRIGLVLVTVGFLSFGCATPNSSSSSSNSGTTAAATPAGGSTTNVAISGLQLGPMDTSYQLQQFGTTNPTVDSWSSVSVTTSSTADYTPGSFSPTSVNKLRIKFNFAGTTPKTFRYYIKNLKVVQGSTTLYDQAVPSSTFYSATSGGTTTNATEWLAVTATSDTNNNAGSGTTDIESQWDLTSTTLPSIATTPLTITFEVYVPSTY